MVFLKKKRETKNEKKKKKFRKRNQNNRTAGKGRNARSEKHDQVRKKYSRFVEHKDYQSREKQA